MAYTKQTWTNGVSKLNATRMQHIEDGLEAAATVADDALDASIIDAKGDLIVGSAADTAARQAVGANNTLVVADSAQTNGIKWAQLTNAMVASGAAIDYSKLNLASSIVNADISASAAIALSKLAASGWTSYTPTVTQSGTVTCTVNYAKYIQVGKLVIVNGQLTVTGSGTGSNDVTVSIPVTAAFATNLAVGIGNIFDSSASLSYRGSAGLSTTTVIVFFPTNTTAPQALGTTQFTAGLASGDVLRFSIAYEAA